MLTDRATKSDRPTQGEQIITAGLLGNEAIFKFGQCSRIVLHVQVHYRL